MIRGNISITAAQSRGVILILLSALFAVCVSLAAMFLLRSGHADAEVRKDGETYSAPHTDGDEEEEIFFDVTAGYVEEIEADQPADSEDDDHHDHDETEEWQFYKIDTSTETRAYKLRARLAARGASVKEDVVKRRRSCGCDGVLI